MGFTGGTSYILWRNTSRRDSSFLLTSQLDVVQFFPPPPPAPYLDSKTMKY